MIFLKKQNVDLYKSCAAQTLLGLCECVVVVTVHADTLLSACILMFWLTLDLLGTRLGLMWVCFPQPMTAFGLRLGAQLSEATARHSDWRKLQMWT